VAEDVPDTHEGGQWLVQVQAEPQMLVVVTRMTASVGSWMIGSGTSSTRTSRLPCQVTACIWSTVPSSVV
jgi:hypothetical protein